MSVRDRLIISAVELLQTHGVAGTAVSDLLERSDTARQSIDTDFPGGKNALITAAVTMCLAAHDTEPLDHVAGHLDTLLRAHLIPVRVD
jgi:AcrR family transcriptional regulator